MALPLKVRHRTQDLKVPLADSRKILLLFEALSNESIFYLLFVEFGQLLSNVTLQTVKCGLNSKSRFSL